MPDNLMHRVQVLFKRKVPSSQRTHSVPITKASHLMLFRETVADYCKDHTAHTQSCPVLRCGRRATVRTVEDSCGSSENRRPSSATVLVTHRSNGETCRFCGDFG